MPRQMHRPALWSAATPVARRSSPARNTTRRDLCPPAHAGCSVPPSPSASPPAAPCSSPATADQRRGEYHFALGAIESCTGRGSFGAQPTEESLSSGIESSSNFQGGLFGVLGDPVQVGTA